MRTEARTTALQCIEGFKTHSRATGFRGFLKLSVTVLGPNDVQQAHDLDAEYQKELVEEVGYGVDGIRSPAIGNCTKMRLVISIGADVISVVDCTALCR